MGGERRQVQTSLLQDFAEGKRNWVFGQVTISVTEQGAAVCPGHGWRQLNTLPTPSAQEPALLPRHDSAHAQCTSGHPCARVLSKDREIWAPCVTWAPGPVYLSLQQAAWEVWGVHQTDLPLSRTPLGCSILDQEVSSLMKEG